MPDNDDIQVDDPELGDWSVGDDFNSDQIIKRASGAEYEDWEQMREARQQVSFWTKLKLTWHGKTKVGRIGGTFLDVAELFAPTWAVKTRDIIQSQTTPNNMSFADKLKKVRNWISWNDKQGNFSFKELGKSILKIAIPAGIVYGLQHFGLWEAVSQLLG